MDDTVARRGNTGEFMNIQKIGERTGITLHRCTAPMRMRFHSFIFHRDTIAADQPRGRVRRLLAMVIFYYENYTSNRTKRFLLFFPLPRLSLSSYLFFFSLFFFSFHPVARLVRRRCHAEHRHFQWNYTAVAAAFQSGRRRGAASHPFASINRRAVGKRVNNSFALAKIFGNVCPRSHRGRLVSVKLQLLSELPIHDISWSARDFIKRVPDIKHTSCFSFLSLFLERTLFPDGNSPFPPSVLLSLSLSLSLSLCLPLSRFLSFAIFLLPSSFNSVHLSLVLASHTADLTALLQSLL